VEIETGLPVEIENLVGSQQLPDQDTLVQRSVNCTDIFNTTKPVYFMHKDIFMNFV